MSFWDWNRWEKELDWMAINGINMPLSIIGNEAVWQNTLKRFNFDDSEIKEFIPVPTYTAWWLMRNLEGWGGSVFQHYIDERVILQKKILSRMRELGMTPVFQGFYGMVPDALRKKFPNNKIYYGGIWAGKNGFARPAFIDPSDTLFSNLAKVFYEEQAKLYGNTTFYGGDPFYGGGNLENVNIKESATCIQNAMLKAHPSLIWVLQGWWVNPKNELLQGIQKEKVLILDLFGEGKPQWERTKGYDGRPWIWCSLLNFGSKIGMYGKLDTFAIAPIRAKQNLYEKSLYGIGTMMEGSEINPINYELIYEMAWHSNSVDVSKWIKDFAWARYGKKLPPAEQAWEILHQTAYNCSSDQEGTFTARGAIDVKGAFKWGTIKIYYDNNMLEQALLLLASCASELKDIDTYQYDIVDIARQVIANYGQKIYHQMMGAYNGKNKQIFETYSNKFIELIDLQDTLLSTRKEFLLGNWLESTKKWPITKMKLN
jgi:alpha-N-acetylglucosaminidase